MPNDNLSIWEKLGKTAPEHTKKFKRAGGFSGTAIKPIYTTKKMTEVFGPAGIGWGMGEPAFDVVPGSDGQVAVFCRVSLWIRDPGNPQDNIVDPYMVWGVGGDMVVVKQTSGLRTDDEAFKKAFTDAVGNAMKHLGMSADVHMGLFDDNKYVASLREGADPETGEIQGRRPSDFDKPESRANSRELFSVVMDQLRTAGNGGKAALRKFWTSDEFGDAYATMPDNFQKELDAERDAFLASYGKPLSKVDPNASLDRQFAETVGHQ